MNTANNQLRQSTDRRLREALLWYMAQDREPTVGSFPCSRDARSTSRMRRSVS